MSDQELSTRETDESAAIEDAPTARERGGAEASREPLLPASAGQGFAGRWTAIQTSFVDEPQQAVHQADLGDRLDRRIRERAAQRPLRAKQRDDSEQRLGQLPDGSSVRTARLLGENATQRGERGAASALHALSLPRPGRWHRRRR